MVMEKSSVERIEKELLPIDIYYNKLLDWLLDRRHCNVKWQAATLEIREKINAAIQDMPPVEEITNLLAGTNINYFHCLRILELLKVSESGSKNIFGGYSSQRMKDWQEIIGFYEKDNVYLAEIASQLIRNVNYEIPSLKRQIGKCQQTQRECTRKENDYTTNAAGCKEEYKKVCEKMGIKGERIKTELMELLNVLPDIFNGVSKSTKSLEDAVQYYKAFIEFISPSFRTDREKDSEILPLLSHIQEHGNTTVYRWRTGEVPTIIKSPDTEINKDDTQAESSTNEIDWGDLGTQNNGETSSDIDWGDSGADTSPQIETDDIDWENAGDATGIIDWGGELDSNIDITVEDSGISLQTGGQDMIAATGTDARTLLDNTETRNIFLDELLELQGFLRQRLTELHKGSDVVSDTQLQTAPHTVQVHSQESVEKMASHVDDVLSQLTNMRVQNLCLLKNSPRYLDRLADTLQQKLRLSEKLVMMSHTMVERRKEAVEQQKELEPQLDSVREKTKQLQSQIAEEISRKYKNRPVNIMGEINSI